MRMRLTIAAQCIFECKNIVIGKSYSMSKYSEGDFSLTKILIRL